MGAILDERMLSTLAEIEALDRQQKASGQNIPFWRVSAENGRLLHILARSNGATCAVEIGTSSGYSGIYIASALVETGGHLWTLDLEPFKVELARQHFERAGLSASVTQVAGDALNTLPDLMKVVPGAVDFAFLDAVKPDYRRYLEILRPKLRRGSVVCADNVGRHNAAAVADYLRVVGSPPFLTAIVPTTNAEDEVDALAVSILQ